LVTGHLGAAGAGLRLARRPKLRSTARAAVLRRLLTPVPRLSEGRVLARSGRVHAMLDLSDGLAGDLRRLSEASGVGVRIDAARLPLASATRRASRDLGCDPFELALCGGEDYELLFAAAPEQAPRLIRELARRTGPPCTIIGEVLPARRGLHWMRPDGREAALPDGWAHESGTGERVNRRASGKNITGPTNRMF